MCHAAIFVKWVHVRWSVNTITLNDNIVCAFLFSACFIHWTKLSRLAYETFFFLFLSTILRSTSLENFICRMFKESSKWAYSLSCFQLTHPKPFRCCCCCCCVAWVTSRSLSGVCKRSANLFHSIIVLFVCVHTFMIWSSALAWLMFYEQHSSHLFRFIQIFLFNVICVCVCFFSYGAQCYRWQIRMTAYEAIAGKAGKGKAKLNEHTE